MSIICSEIDIIEVCDGDIAHRYEPKNVIFNGPATIVFWNDGTKTVVKCEGEAFDKEKGLAMAIAKRALGDKGSYYNVFKKWCVEDDDEELRNYETLTTNSLTSSFVTIAEDFNKSIEESVKRMFGSSD